MSELAPPLPVLDDQNRPYWEALARHEFLLQRCADCNAWQTPVAFRCTACLSDALEWRQAAGRGEIYSFVIYHQAFEPAFKDALPYNVAIVTLEEGPRVVTNIVGCAHEDLRIGMPVSALFEEVAGGVTLARFAPEPAP